MAKYIVHKAVELDALSAKTKEELEKVDEWIISPKYDGCHVVFFFEDGKHVDTRSRSGERVLSMDHVGQDLLRAYPALRTTFKVAICGEAWAPGQDFNVISGAFRRQSPQLGLMFVPFDWVGWAAGELFSNRTYSERLAKLRHREESSGASVLPVVAYTYHGPLSEAIVATEAQALRYKASTTGAYDGLILAQAQGTYEVGSGRGGEFIKVKPLISYTVTVTGYECSTGAKTGKNTGALTFLLDGLHQRVSTGLTQAQVDSFNSYEEASDGSLLDTWLGKRIEVEAMGKTVNGFLREPRFKGIRDDA